MVTKERPEVWDIESTLLHRPNVVSYEVFTKKKWIIIIRAYLLPANMNCLPYHEEAVNGSLVIDIIVMGPERGCGVDGEPLEPAGGILPSIFLDG